MTKRQVVTLTELVEEGEVCVCVCGGLLGRRELWPGWRSFRT